MPRPLSNVHWSCPMPEPQSIATKARYRRSTPSDLPAIQEIESLSYPPQETGLAGSPIATATNSLSLIAEIDGKPVGHILLTEISGPDRALALAPLAVLPAWREMLIGTELVRHALELARQQGWQSVFVFGQPDYYCRFGFRSRTADGAEIAIQGPRFLALELNPGALTEWTGRLNYPEAFLLRHTVGGQA